jgi:hypothetical protein
MLHLVVLAMIDLWDIDPDAAKPPPAQFGQRLAGAGDASDALLDTGAALGPSPIKVCTYGAPPLGSQLWSDASGLMRTFTTPSCGDGAGGFQSGFASQSLLGFFPLGMALPWGSSLTSPGTPVGLPGQSDSHPSRQGLTLPHGFEGPSSLVLHVPPAQRGASSGTSSAARSQVRHPAP